MLGNSTSLRRSRKAGRSQKRKSGKSSWSVQGFKIKRPYPDFPLSPHCSGKWQKRIRGDVHYFGRWAHMVNGQLECVEGDGWEEALKIYKSQADDLHAGRTPRTDSDKVTVADLCNAFLNAKLQQRQAGEISARMFEQTANPKKPKGEYPATTDRLIATFGGSRLVCDLTAKDFEALRADLANLYGPVRLANEIQKVRTVFKYGVDSEMFDRPVRFGPQFKKPSRKVLRLHKQKQKRKNGERKLKPDEVRKLINSAEQPIKAMLLLGINAAFGPHDLATLPLVALDLDAGWVEYARPKTGIERKAKLWPETIISVRQAIAIRPSPKTEEDAKLVFLTVRGSTWVCRESGNPISVRIRGLMKEIGIHRPGIGAYVLRHTFRTVADKVNDRNAIRLVMGHADEGEIDSHYIEEIEDDRLLAVSEHVRAWLFGADQKPAEKEMTTPSLRVVG